MVATGTTQFDPVFEQSAPVRPISVQGGRSRSGFKGSKTKSSHMRVKSAAPGGRNMQPARASSVADFVAASADPRGGIWASKSYKTPI